MIESRRISWARAPIREFTWIDDHPKHDARAWTIQELCTNAALFMEGRAMRHCVGIYVQRCLRHRTSIWSMQVETKHGQRHVLTIEVDTDKRRIGLVKRKCNEDPNDVERAVVSRWAAREGLALPESFVRR